MRTLFAILLTVSCSFAIPQLINYQGKLTTPDGNPLDTTVAITFGIYMTANGGAPAWTETHPLIDVSEGLFQVLLGSVTELGDLFSENVWLGLTIGEDSEMTPREQIVSTAYSYRVGTVDGASGGTITGKLNVGSGNSNTDDFSMVFGQNNTSDGLWNVVSGGLDNSATSGAHNTVSGGSENSALFGHSTVGGGLNNVAHIGSAIGGGFSNSALFEGGAIAGGQGNQAGGSYATVAGGLFCSVIGDFGTISGGSANLAAHGASVGGGNNNKGRGNFSTIGGGGGLLLADSNSAQGMQSTISGGSRNRALSAHNAIGGGLSNMTNGLFSVVGGGNSNQATGLWSAIAGGSQNVASAEGAFVGGGILNVSDGFEAVVGGGLSNIASGAQATVPGGNSNAAIGTFSFAAGHRASADHAGAFVWADGTNATFHSDTSNTFSVRASRGTRIYSNGTLTSGVTLGAGGNSWVAVSDSNRKRDIRETSTADVLRKIASLPIKNWEYKSEDEGTEHMGPMAQDFWNAFGLGSDSLGIETIDADGVLFAAVQELAKQVKLLHDENREMRSSIQQLQTMSINK